MPAAVLFGALFVNGADPAQQPTAPAAMEPIAAVLDAFRSHRIVAIADEHGNEQLHSFRLALIRDSRFPSLVDDIVVEFGNSRYQDVIDGFTAGEDVPDVILRQVWQNTTQPHAIWDRPIYEEFFRAVRAVNLSLPPARRLRVVLGDPPIEWRRVRTLEDIRQHSDRSRHPAEVAGREVLAKNRRALVIYGGGHIVRQNITGATMVEHLDRMAPGQVFTVMTHPSVNLEVTQPDVKTWRAPSVTLTAATPLDNVTDAVLYLGPSSAITYSRLSSALCADAAYRQMRISRMALVRGFDKATEALKQECEAPR